MKNVAKKVWFGIFCLLAVVLIIGASDQLIDSTQVCANTDEKADMNIQNILQKFVEDNDSVGASVGLIDRGEIKFFSYGKKSVESNDVVSEDTIYEIGSITKVFTTTALMDLVTQGKVKMDDPIEIYLSGVKVPELDGKKITLRHLATHTSGLPRMPDNFDPKTPSNPYIDYSVDRLYEFLNHCILQKAPGTHFEYSNVGMGLLGHILCKITEKTYEQLIAESLLTKLDMKNTGVFVSSERARDFARGHHQGQIVDYWDFTQAIEGAGSLRSNVKDMTQFLSANMGLINIHLTELLSRCHQVQNSAGPNDSVGLGWVISHSDAGDVIWHNGGTGGFRTFLGFNLKTQKGVVVLSNSSAGWPDLFGLSLLDPDNYKQPVKDAVLASDSSYLKQFEGFYDVMTSDQQRMEVAIKLIESRLILVMPGGELKMIPTEIGVFSMQGVPGQVLKFIFDDKGNIVKAQMIIQPSHAVAGEVIPKAHVE